MRAGSSRPFLLPEVVVAFTSFHDQQLLNAVAMLQPKILYPYHITDTNMAKVEEALRAVPGVEVRIRPMK